MASCNDIPHYPPVNNKKRLCTAYQEKDSNFINTSICSVYMFPRLLTFSTVQKAFTTENTYMADAILPRTECKRFTTAPVILNGEFSFSKHKYFPPITEVGYVNDRL
jgi:hypothetical protein